MAHASESAGVNVFVTGFGPFPKFDNHGGMYEHNASHLITKLLPSSLPASHPANSSKRHINIINPTAGKGQFVKTEYAYIRSYVSDLHDTHKDDVDLFLHLGMADGWGFVTVERRAYKQGFSSDWCGKSGEKAYYMLEDAAGKTVLDAPPCPWGADVPIGLSTDLGVDAIVVSANERLVEMAFVENEVEPEFMKVDKLKHLLVQPHHEAGNYGCGFTYYESLANKYVKGSKGSVIFCHVPGEVDDESLERAKNTVVAIIGAAVDERLKKQKREVIMENSGYGRQFVG